MTTHETGARDALQRFLRRPHGGSRIAETVDGLASGRWPSWYVDTIGQSSWGKTAPSAWPMEQIYAFMLFDNWIQRGALAVLDIHVGTGPSSDSHRAENQDALDRLQAPFVAAVDQDQYCEDADGYLTWDQPFEASVLAQPGDWAGGDGRNWLYGQVTKIGKVPLEVGSTTASVSALHIAEGRALARWPYGHEKIRLFLAPEKFHFIATDSTGKTRAFVPEHPTDKAARRRRLPSPEELLAG